MLILCSSRSSPTSRSSTPTTSRNDPHNVRKSARATTTGRAARSSPPTARSSRESVPTDGELQVPARVPAGRPVRADQRLPVVRRREHGRRGELRQGAHRAGRAACSSTTSADLSRQDRHRQRRALAVARRRSRPRADALGGQTGSVVALDIADGRDARDVLEPDVQPEPARRYTTRQAVQATFNLLNSDAARPALRALVPRALSHRARRSRSSPPRAALDTGIATPDRPVHRRVGRSSSRGPNTDRAQLRRRDVRRDAHREPHPLVQRDLRAGSAPSSADAFAPAMNAVRRGLRRRRSRRRSTSIPARSASVGPAVGRSTDAAVRPRRHRPGRRVPSRRSRWR